MFLAGCGQPLTRLWIPLVAKENVTWHMLALALEPQVWGLQRKVY